MGVVSTTVDSRVTGKDRRLIKLFFSVYLYTHHPSQIRYLENRSFLSLRVGVVVWIADRVELTYLAEDDVGFSCSHDTNSAFDDCVVSRSRSELCRRLGCASPFLPPTDECSDCRINLFNST